MKKKENPKIEKKLITQILITHLNTQHVNYTNLHKQFVSDLEMRLDVLCKFLNRKTNLIFKLCKICCHIKILRNISYNIYIRIKHYVNINIHMKNDSDL